MANLATLLKNTPAQVFSGKFFETIKGNFSIKRLLATGSES